MKTINIRGKNYVPVSERVKEIHQVLKDEVFSITTELLPNDKAVIFKATITIGDRVFTGHSGANPEKAIEKQSPYEVAETSAIGRALGFAGFGIEDGIASADEITKAEELGF
jgi:hypothetical protein